ncbi:hypothetical protein WICPIJ_004590 [Wickerhamomyces pijperi]|uniref:Uncharacterized protein n=1 Tax=Wickerhamomyces pijperi TaxID=599730 RepID=A0A9P8TMM0_WICPI|nr:hypothetical protein WICPIJ_004590 [Wickerhamomyces pijperi]
MDCQFFTQNAPISISRSQSYKNFNMALPLYHVDIVIYDVDTVIPEIQNYNLASKTLNSTFSVDFANELLQVTTDTDSNPRNIPLTENSGLISYYNQSLNFPETDYWKPRYHIFTVEKSGYYCIHSRRYLSHNETLTVQYSEYSNVLGASLHGIRSDTFQYNETDGEYYSEVSGKYEGLCEKAFTVLDDSLDVKLEYDRQMANKLEFSQNMANRGVLLLSLYTPLLFLLLMMFALLRHKTTYRLLYFRHVVLFFVLFFSLELISQVFTIASLRVLQTAEPATATPRIYYNSIMTRESGDDFRSAIVLVAILAVEGTMALMWAFGISYKDKAPPLYRISRATGARVPVQQDDRIYVFPVPYNKYEASTRLPVLAVIWAVNTWILKVGLHVLIAYHKQDFGMLMFGSYEGYGRLIKLILGAGGVIALACVCGIVLHFEYYESNQQEVSQSLIKAIRGTINGYFGVEELQISHMSKFRIWLLLIYVSYLIFYAAFIVFYVKTKDEILLFGKDPRMISMKSIIYCGYDVIFWSWCLLLVFVVWDKWLLWWRVDLVWSQQLLEDFIGDRSQSRVRNPGTVMSSVEFTEFVLLNVGHGNGVSLLVALDWNLSRHTPHSVDLTFVASVNQQADIRGHEPDRHVHLGTVWKDELRMGTERFDVGEDVIPSTTVQTSRMITELIDNLIHLESGWKCFN